MPVYLLGLVASALVGALVKAYFERADPDIKVTSVRVLTPTTEQLLAEGINEQLRGTASSGSIIINSRLEELANDHNWLPSLDSDISHNDYLIYLITTRDKANDIASSMAQLRNDLKEWPPRIDNRSIDKIYELIRNHAELINASVFGRIRRNQTVFRGPEITEFTQTPLYDIDVDDDNDIFLDSGSKRLPIVWSTHPRSPKERKECEACARRLANAIAYMVVDDLNDLKQVITGILNEESPTKEILQIIDRELQLNSFVVTSATIANDGKTTMSFDPRAALYLHTKEIEYRDENNEPQTLESNIKITMQASNPSKQSLGMSGFSLDIESDQYSSRPIVIPGGTALTVSFRSLSRISNLPLGTQFLQVYRANGAKATLAVLPLTSGALDERAPITSEPYLARDIVYETVFPDDLLEKGR